MYLMTYLYKHNDLEGSKCMFSHLQDENICPQKIRLNYFTEIIPSPAPSRPQNRVDFQCMFCIPDMLHRFFYV